MERYVCYQFEQTGETREMRSGDFTLKEGSSDYDAHFLSYLEAMDQGITGDVKIYKMKKYSVPEWTIDSDGSCIPSQQFEKAVIDVLKISRTHWHDCLTDVTNKIILCKMYRNIIKMKTGATASWKLAKETIEKYANIDIS